MNQVFLLSCALGTQLVGLMCPGPDFALILKTSLTENRKQAFQLVLGMTAGMIIHSSYSVFLLPYFLNKSHLIIYILKYLGAAYLLYMGITSLIGGFKSLQLKNKNRMSQTPSIGRLKRPFVSGILCNITNPKCILSYITIFSIVLSVNSSFLLRVSTAIIMPLMGFLWFGFLVYILTSEKVKSTVDKIENFQQYITLIAGIVFIIFATLLLFLKI